MMPPSFARSRKGTEYLYISANPPEGEQVSQLSSAQTIDHCDRRGRQEGEGERGRRRTDRGGGTERPVGREGGQLRSFRRCRGSCKSRGGQRQKRRQRRSIAISHFVGQPLTFMAVSLSSSLFLSLSVSVSLTEPLSVEREGARCFTLEIDRFIKRRNAARLAMANFVRFRSIF